jgi:hypothetical protein
MMRLSIIRGVDRFPLDFRPARSVEAVRTTRSTTNSTKGATLRRVLLMTVVAGVVGCGEPAPTGTARPTDPQIKVKDAIGGGVGPVGGGRGREYEGPASQAPKWVKDQQGK